MLTPNGWVFAGSAAVLVVLGAVLDYRELVGLAVAMILALAVAAAWIVRRPKVTARRVIHPPRVAEGEPAEAVVTVENTGRTRTAPISARETVGHAKVDLMLPSLAAGQSHSAAYTLPTHRRGRYEVGPLSLAQSDPLRLVRFAQAEGAVATLFVHPRHHRVAPLPTGRSRDLEGPTSSTAPRGGITFHSLRTYEPGDDLRLIHWRSTARTGTLMVRHNVIANEPRQRIVLDTSAAPYDQETFEDAVRVAASLVLAGVQHGYPTQLFTSAGERVDIDLVGNGQTAALDVLAAAMPADDDPGLDYLPHITLREPGVALGVVTGQPEPDRVINLSAVRSRYEMMTVIQVGERFGRPPVAVRGAISLNCLTSTDFVAAWKRRIGS